MERIEGDYKDAKRLLVSVRSKLTKLASGKDTSIFLQGDLATSVKALNEITERLQNDLAFVPPSKADVWSSKIKLLIGEAMEIRSSVECKFSEINKKNIEEEEKKYIDLEYGQKAMSTEERKAYHDMGQSMSNSQRIANEINEMALAVLHSVSDQNITMKKIHKKVMDVMNVFETSRSVMRMIEKRQYTDKMIVYTGILFITFLVIIIWWLRS
uniref:t-SNARE coiled-coil homology domain-containing protein n=1 Tax=Arcella intermedia TaxID=1963864 RepID=A0A6B2LHW1_9EUKA